MHEGGRHAVLARLHEAEHCLARQRQFVRLARVRRFSWLCRSNRWRRLCLRDEPDGNTINRRSAGCGTQRSTLAPWIGSAATIWPGSIPGPDHQHANRFTPCTGSIFHESASSASGTSAGKIMPALALEPRGDRHRRGQTLPRIGTSPATFDQTTSTTLDNPTNPPDTCVGTGYYQKICHDFLVEPYTVNEDASGNFLGRINYVPYTPCN